MVTKGRISTADLERLYKGRIDSESLICTDSHKRYIQFAKDNVKGHIRIPRGNHKNDVYHISHINGIHSKFEKWMERFNGVATKYLDNYLHWFKWLESSTTEKDITKARHLVISSAAKLTDVRLEHY
jgi:hypothetical protein